MPFTLRVHVGQKRSPAPYETISVAADITAESLEISSPEAIQQKLREMHLVAQSSVQTQLLDLMPTAEERRTEIAQRNGTTARNENGNDNGNGRRRTYGRPSPQPSQKQLVLLRRLCSEKGLDASAVGDLADRLIGVPLKSCTMADVSRLIDCLLEEQAS